MTQQNAIDYWRKSSQDALKTARVLQSKKRTQHALFFCHLAIEKLLKGLIVQRIGKHPPFIHDLAKLANCAQIDLSAKQAEELSEIASFNIAARYDDEKNTFWKKARGRYAARWFKVSERYIRWLQSQF